MSKKYFWLTLIQGVFIAVFLIYLPKYIHNDTLWNYILILLPFNGIVFLNRIITREEMK